MNLNVFLRTYKLMVAATWMLLCFSTVVFCHFRCQYDTLRP